MNESLKVQPHHLERGAYLYIRQSSMRQVIENIESTKRQYALRDRATALGWRDEQVIVIDSDQGQSGASAAWREGFQRLVTDVGMGRAGIVMGLEVSRLARNNADWHRLLEICALADTLILDEDGVYDPTTFNDRSEGLRFPSRLHNRAAAIFRPLTASTAMRTLNNPRYAGAYVYGRRRYRRVADGKKKIQRKRECGDWLACIPNAHPGYITWEQFQQNVKILETNGRGYQVARASPPREGAALLQGRAVCGRCGRHFRVRYAARRGRLEAWYVCDRAHGDRGEPNCQSIAGPPIDEAIGTLVTEKMTPAAVELALEIRKEIEARYKEADLLRCRAIERAQIEADLAQRRFMLVDPSNRLVADTLEGEWNEKLRALAKAREEREGGRQADQHVLDDAARERLVAMTTNFKKLWADPGTPNRERKRLLAYIIEDATLIKFPVEGTTKIHVRFKGGKAETLTALNPKSSAQQVKTQPKVVELVDKLLDDNVYSGIADLLNEQGFRPGGSARRGRGDTRFTALRVAYLVHRYGLRSRYDRLRDRGMLTKEEAAACLEIHESTLLTWAEHGIVRRHAYNAHAYLYEAPGPNPPVKQCSRWNRLVDRAAAIKTATASKPSYPIEGGAV